MKIICIIAVYGAVTDRLVIEPITKNIYFTAVRPTEGLSFIAALSPAGDFLPIVFSLNKPRDIAIHPERRYMIHPNTANLQNYPNKHKYYDRQVLTNSRAPDQMSRNDAASGQGLHCLLLMSIGTDVYRP